ncbi:MAG TPA: NAD(P)-dependent oxidoreductase [Steroidobacteraceae bacterium]
MENFRTHSALSASHVALVPTPYVATHFETIASDLRDGGVNVTIFKSVQECLSKHREQAIDVILAMHNFPMSRDFLSATPGLRAALSFITGTEGFDENAATDLGIIVANGQIPENFHSMAEATILLMLAAFYDLNGAQRNLREKQSSSGQLRAKMLMGKTVGIVGFGKIARALTVRLAAWGIRIQVYTRRPDVTLPHPLVRVELDDLCRTSDCIVLLANLNSESRHLLDERRLKLIKPGAILVNTARGGLIDERKLVEVAKQGRFRMLALDTFEHEPLADDSPLRTLPNTILTGHDVGHTVETHEAMVATAVENIMRILRGQLPSNIRNPIVIDRWLSRWHKPT